MKLFILIVATIVLTLPISIGIALLLPVDNTPKQVYQQRKMDTIKYIHDKRTNLCYAEIQFPYGITTVPCANVMPIIEEGE